MYQILVQSIIDKDNNSKVLIAYEPKKIELILTSEQAFKHGIALLKATLIAEYEANLLFKLSPLYNQTGKGFGNKRKNEEIHAAFLKTFRDCRPELPDFVEPIFGYNTQKPLVNYFLNDYKLQLQIDECLFHAGGILQCAEASTTDEFLLDFCQKIDIDKIEAMAILRDFATFRKATWLERLL